MKVSSSALLSAIMIVATMPSIWASSIRGLQGQGRGNKGPDKGDAGGRGGGDDGISSCTADVLAYLQIPGKPPIPGGEEKHGCTDDSGNFIPLDLDEEQARSMKELVQNGKLTYGRSKIDVSEATVWKSGKHKRITLKRGQSISVLKGPPSTRGQGNPSIGSGRDGDGRNLQDQNGVVNKYFLMFRITDSEGLVVGDEAGTMSDNLFGTGTDAVNFKSQMAACSVGKYNVIPGVKGNYDISELENAPGVIDITIDIPLTWSSDDDIDTAAITAARNLLADHHGEQNLLPLTAYVDHAMFSKKGCYPTTCPYAAYAQVGNYFQMYQGPFYSMPGVQMHEHGHNMQLAHSGGLDGQTYTDHTCLMGNPLYSDDLGQMCFNAAKNWQMQFNPHPTTVISGWYDDQDFIEVDTAATGAQTFKMMGVGEYNLQGDGVNISRKAIVLKVLAGAALPQYVGFNSAKGANIQNDEADDQVTIIEYYGLYYSTSKLKGYVNSGESFTTAQGRVITAQCINTAITPSLACVCVRANDQETCPDDCTCTEGPAAPTPPPAPTSPSPTTPPPTPCGGVEMTISITTDKWASETKWELTNMCDDSTAPVKTGGNYVNSDTLHAESFCLPDDEYKFIIEDSYGDGICCEWGDGSYEVHKDGVLQISGGQFGSNEVQSFGNCGAVTTTTSTTTTPATTTTSTTTSTTTMSTTPATTTTTTTTTTGTSTDEVAEYNFTHKAPHCSNVGTSCTSGPDLLKGTQGNVEPNDQNTIDGCADGTYGRYEVDESVDMITISALEGDLQAGQLAKITTYVHAWKSSGALDSADFYITNLDSPSWSYVGTAKPTAGGFQTLESSPIALLSGSTQVVRVKFRFGGTTQSVESACGVSGWDDTDDLIFAVAPANPGQIPAVPMKMKVPAPEPIDVSICATLGKNRCYEASDLCRWQNGRNKGCFPKESQFQRRN